MLNLIITITSITFLVILMATASHILPMRKIYLEKSSPYECGFDPLKLARMPFSFRFFLVAILFLLFDLEMALMLPLPLNLFFSNPKTTVTLLTAFIIILTMGLMYEWTKGGLNWAE